MANKTGVELIAEERKRQIEVEGWHEGHDDNHIEGDLAQAGICYAQIAEPQVRMRTEIVPDGRPAKWPWERRWWKPSADPVRNLVKAGALIAAEIDRIQRERHMAEIAAKIKEDTTHAS